MARQEVDERDSRVPVGPSDGRLDLAAHERMSIQIMCINILLDIPLPMGER
jgi:hypothetical protein